MTKVISASITYSFKKTFLGKYCSFITYGGREVFSSRNFVGFRCQFFYLFFSFSRTVPKNSHNYIFCFVVFLHFVFFFRLSFFNASRSSNIISNKYIRASPLSPSPPDLKQNMSLFI